MENTSYNEIKDKTKTLSIIRKIIIYTLLTIWAIIVIFPFYWMLLTSIKSTTAYNSEMIPQFITLSPTFDNYLYAWKEYNFVKYLLNTVIYAVLTTVLMIIVTILSAFAFSRLEFKGKNLVFTIFLAMMMIPNELVIITNYTTIVNLGWRNSFVGLVLPSILSIFYIYLLRQNFMQVPDDMYYAAKVDGTSDLKYLIKILIPLSKPTIVSIIVLKIIECWNSFVWPRIVTTNEKYYLVSQAIDKIRSDGSGRENIPAMMAAVMFVSLPLLLLFIIFRKQIMSGVSKTGSKG